MFHERNAQAVDILCFLRQSFSLVPTTGTGNEIRKSGIYRASRGFCLVWSFGVGDANDLVNAKSHARGKPLLAG